MKFLSKTMSELWGWKVPHDDCGDAAIMLNFHAFKTILTSLILVYEMDRSLPAPISIFIWYFSVHFVVKDMDSIQLFAWRIVGAVCFSLRQPFGLIPFGLMIIMAEKKHPLAPHPLVWGFTKLAFERTRSVDSWLTVGNNEIGFFKLQEMFFTDIVGLIKLYINSTSLVPRIYPKYLRANGVANNIREIGDAFASPDECIRKVEEANKLGRLIALAGTGVLVIMVYSAPSVLFSVFLLGVFLRDKVMESSDDGISMSGLADGVYRLQKVWLGITLSKSIGVVYEGVMHGAYHGLSNCDLVTAGRVYAPAHVDTERDFVTWGGKARFARVKVDDEVIVNSEDDNGRASYKVPISVAEDGSFSWPGMTEPGESGSPVWALRNESLYLLGLAGNWVTIGGGKKSEFIKASEIDILDVPRRIPGEITRVCKHPGYGKTRKIIAGLISEEITRKRAKIVVLGPTRVVCIELANALVQRFPRQVCLDISDAPKEDTHAKVRIMAHATYVNRLLRESPSVTGLTTLIIDEVHVDDAATDCIRRISAHLSGIGTSVIQLSATFDDEKDEGSNYPIEDVMMDESRMITEAVDAFLDEGRKSLIFVKGVRGSAGADALHVKIRKQTIGLERRPRVLILSRLTFKSAMESIRTGDYDIVLSTNIAECGINLDVDDVYDCCSQFGFIEEDGDIVGTERTINVASRIQRRGRVGRRKNGRYFFAKEPDERKVTTAAEFDGKLLAGALIGEPQHGKWAVSRKQAAKALELGISPRSVTLEYGIDGRKKSPAEVRASVTDWANSGSSDRRSCGEGKVKCSCIGRFEWFDERDHDYLVKLINGLSRPEVRKAVAV